MSSSKSTLLMATIFGALAVLIGAFGAHALPDLLAKQGLDSAAQAKRMDNLEVGARYHMYHALAPFGLGIWQRFCPGRGRFAGLLFTLGILVFSGCLYGYGVSGNRTLAMIVPIGGVSFIAGWVALAVSVARGTGSPNESQVD